MNLNFKFKAGLNLVCKGPVWIQVLISEKKRGLVIKNRNILCMKIVFFW